jgi:heat shock protein HslJ
MEKNRTILSIGVILVATLGVVAFLYFAGKNVPASNGIGTSAKDATYVIEGKSVTLMDGVSVVPLALDSALQVTTRYFGNEVTHDFDGDGRQDTVFILTQNMGGTGTFYYVVAALNTVQGYVGSHGLFLGDRIAPQTIEMSKEASTKDVIIVNYADRKPNEGFATSPSVAKSIWLKLDLETMQFGEVAQNFEGEADPSRMKLGMKTWIWVSAVYNDGREIKPKKEGVFTIIFDEAAGRFSATTDCNQMNGSYATFDGSLSFSQITSTKMYCAGSQEAAFAKLLETTGEYLFTSRGQMILNLKFDSGSVIFQ